MSIFGIVMLVIFVIFLGFQLFYIVSAWTNRGHNSLIGLREKPISIMIPAYNETNVIKGCLKGLLELNYANHEVIFINDGSNDETMYKFEELLQLERTEKATHKKLSYAKVKQVYQSKNHPHIFVIDKYNGGKADALNAGIDYATNSLIITLDADSILDKDSMNYINERFYNKNVIAAGGMVHVGQMFEGTINNSRLRYKGNGLLKYQFSGYFASFYIKKLAQSKVNTMAIVSGAFGAFRQDILFNIGGYKKTVGEDMEITLSIQLYMQKFLPKGKLIFIPEAVAFTEVPDNVRDLFKQRIRWQKGFIDCLIKYRKCFFNEFTRKFSSFLLLDSLVVSFFGVVSLLFLPMFLLSGQATTIFYLLFSLSYISEFVLRMSALFVAKRFYYKLKVIDYFRMAIFLIIEGISYRFLDVWFFAYGSVTYFFHKEHEWNKVSRLGNVMSEEKAS